MNNVNFADKYAQINNSFPKKLLFGIGLRSGFFSEFNCMVFAIVYCLQHQINFTLASQNANFGCKYGWNDYFEPFVKENNQWLLSIFNDRFPEKGFSFKQWLAKPIRKKMGYDYLTFELFYTICAKENDALKYNIPELAIKGDLKAACKVVIENIWKFNEKTAQKIKDFKQAIKLPEKYLGMHIRRGDKKKEWDYVELERFINKVTELSDIRDVFLSTDDYSVYEEAVKKYPQWRFYTLCEQETRGYDHGDFAKTRKERKYKHIANLLACMEILRHAEHFIGSFNSNLGVFLGIMLDQDHCHNLDAQSWR